MKDYKGVVKITCNKGQKPCPRKITGQNVRSDCASCEYSESTIINLGGEVLHKFPVPDAEKTEVKKTIKKGG
jgi:hypothetical protein